MSRVSCLVSRTYTQQYHSNTHINDFLSVSDEQVPEDSSFVEVSQADHVLHTVDGGGMHRLDVGGVLGGDPVLLGGERGREETTSTHVSSC